MENAASALKIAFGIFVFVTAFTTVFMMLTQAKDTADVVSHYSDQTNWYEYLDKEKVDNKPGDYLNVGSDTVISSLYSIYDENIDVTIIMDPTEKYRFNSNNYYENNNRKETFKSNKEFTNKVNEFINNKLSSGEFTMSCKEIKTSGIYEYGKDGTEIVKAQGGTKLYITYTKA